MTAAALSDREFTDSETASSVVNVQLPQQLPNMVRSSSLSLCLNESL